MLLAHNIDFFLWFPFKLACCKTTTGSSGLYCLGERRPGTLIAVASRHSLRIVYMPLDTLFLPCRYIVVDYFCFRFFPDFVWLWLCHCMLEVGLLLLIRGRCALTMAVMELVHKRIGGSLMICLLDEQGSDP